NLISLLAWVGLGGLVRCGHEILPRLQPPDAVLAKVIGPSGARLAELTVSTRPGHAQGPHLCRDHGVAIFVINGPRDDPGRHQAEGDSSHVFPRREVEDTELGVVLALLVSFLHVSVTRCVDCVPAWGDVANDEATTTFRER